MLDCIERFWILPSFGESMPVTVWAWDGKRVCVYAKNNDAFAPAFDIDIDFYPLTLSPSRAVIVGAEQSVSLRGEGYRVDPKTHLVLNALLAYLLSQK